MPPSPRRSPRATAAAPTGRRWNLRLSTLVVALFLSVAAVALAYVTGVMLGRASMNAERAAAQAQAASGGDAATRVEGGQDTMPNAASDPGAADAGGEHPGRRILAAEELRFARALRNEEERGAPAQGATPDPTPRAPAAGAGTAPGAAGTAAQGMQGVQQTGQTAATATSGAGSAPGMAQPGQPAAAEAMARQPADAVRDYVFQVGAFRDEASVDALRERLEGYGLRTRMQREGKLLVVLVLVRGTPARASEVVAAAEALRLGAPILRSSRPVTP